MAFQGDSIYWVEVGKIVPNPFQPRREFDESKLKELSESIRMYGILQPLTVTRNEIQSEDGAFYTEYELIAGERRLRASKLAGLEQVPVIIRSGQDTEQEKLELAIIENLQREDLNAVDRALAFKQLAEVFELSHAQVAKKVGRSREYVSNSIRLLGLPEYMLNSLKLGDISEGHARTLLMLRERPEEQDVVYREILLKKLSVREVERIARKIATDKVRKKRWNDTDAHLIEIEKEFTNTLGTRVQIAKTDFGGKLTIDYFSDDDLHKLLEMMQSQGKMSNKTKTVAEGNPDSDESETEIHEMSPEASILAKIALATPLMLVEEPAEEVSADAVSPLDTPAPAITPHAAVPDAYAHQALPVEYTPQTLPVIRMESAEAPTIVPSAPAPSMGTPEVVEEVVLPPHVEATAPDPYIPAAVPTPLEQAPEPEKESIVHQVPPRPFDHMQTDQYVAHAEGKPEPIDLDSDEFSFIQHRAPSTHMSHGVAEDQNPEVSVSSEDVQHTEVVSPVAKDQDRDEEEDLYSMKNFSL